MKPLYSMTGHGRAAAQGVGCRAEVELGSVNRKQLEVRVRLPAGLEPLESRIQAAIQERISRGQVSGTVNVQGLAGAAGAVRVNTELAADYVRALRAAGRKLKLADNLSIGLLAGLPGVIRSEPPEADVARVWPVVERALISALAQLVAMRASEGAALRRDLLARLDGVERLARTIAGRAPRVAGEYAGRLRERLATAGLRAALDDERLLKEIALFADRCDITEEVTRLRSHLRQMRALLKEGGSPGRTLDFLAQEFIREINTIGSKANDAAIAGAVVDFKAEIERIREQAQNIA